MGFWFFLFYGIRVFFFMFYRLGGGGGRWCFFLDWSLLRLRRGLERWIGWWKWFCWFSLLIVWVGKWMVLFCYKVWVVIMCLVWWVWWWWWCDFFCWSICWWVSFFRIGIGWGFKYCWVVYWNGDNSFWFWVFGIKYGWWWFGRGYYFLFYSFF